MTDQSDAMRSKSFIVELPTRGVPIKMNMELLPTNDWLISERAIADVSRKTQQAVRKQIASITNEDAQVPALNQMAFQTSKTLAITDLTNVNHVISGSNTRPSNCYTLLTAALVWQKFAENGCKNSLAAISALVVESLETRADAVAGILRSQAERDERMSRSQVKVFLLESGLGELAVRQSITASYQAAVKRHPALITEENRRVYISKLLRFLEPADQARFTPLLVDRPYLLIHCSGDKKSGITIASETYQEHLDRMEETLGRVFSLDEADPEGENVEDPFLLKF